MPSHSSISNAKGQQAVPLLTRSRGDSCCSSPRGAGSAAEGMPNTGRSSASVASPVPSTEHEMPPESARLPQGAASLELSLTRRSKHVPRRPPQARNGTGNGGRPRRAPSSRAEVLSARSASSCSGTAPLARPSSASAGERARERARFLGICSIASSSVSDYVPPSGLTARINAALRATKPEARDMPPMTEQPSSPHVRPASVCERPPSTCARPELMIERPASVSERPAPIGGRLSPVVDAEKHGAGSAVSSKRSAPLAPRPCSVASATKDDGACSSARNSFMSEGTNMKYSAHQPATLINPPWSVERANQDQPNWGRVLQQQQDYHRMLDEQSNRKAEVAKRRVEEDLDLERRTHASLATHSHKWGGEGVDIGRERAVFKELVATVAHRERMTRQSKDAEKAENQRWAVDSDQKLARQWLTKKQQNKKEWAGLVSAWTDAADAKRTRKDEERATSLRCEREHNCKVLEGMGEPRRMRKAVTSSARDATNGNGLTTTS